MDTDTLVVTTLSVADGDRGGSPDTMPNDNGKLKENPSDKQVMREVENALIGFELDLACCSEKLANMNLLKMHVAERESDFEAFSSVEEDSLVDLRALEFDMLSSVFDFEVRELGNFIDKLRTDINRACEVISSHKHLGEDVFTFEEKLHDAEKSLKQSQEQVSELTMQSVKFRRIVSNFNREETSNEDKGASVIEDGDLCNIIAKLKMQTPEQQRHILRMLEKSLARELDLENQLTECMEALDIMNLKLHYSQQEVLSKEEESTAVYARFLEADNASAVLMGISKDLVGQLQSGQLKINSALHRESQINIKLQNCMQVIKKLEKEAEESNLEAVVLKEKVNTLHEQLNASESMVLKGNEALDGSKEQHEMKELQEKIVIAENRAEKAEAECKLLSEANKGLNEELDLLKASDFSHEKVDTLEKLLRESDFQQQQAMASVEASLEKQSMLYSSMNDMENLIGQLKSKILKADDRADSAEDKCIILSESHAELNEELNFLRGKVECLEESLQRAEDTKLAAAKDVNIRTKMITDLVMQLAIERERLQKQIYFLTKENRALTDTLQVANNVSFNSMNLEYGETRNGVVSSDDQACSITTKKGDKDVFGTFEVEKSAGGVVNGELKSDPEDLKFKIETVRTIDAGRLSFKYVLSASLIAFMAVLAICFLWPEKCPF